MRLEIRTVLFDLDGTLLDRRATFRLHLEDQVRRHPGLFQSADGARFIETLLALDENGTLDRREFHRRVESDFGLPPGSASVLHSDFESRFPEQCVPMAGLVETLEALRAHGIPLGIITNGRALIQDRKIDGLGIRHYFATVVISDSVGIRKPDRRIFDHALQALGAPAASTAYVGDNPEPDIRGARAVGMIAIWQRDPFWEPPAEADLIIEELSDLVRIVVGESGVLDLDGPLT